MKREHLSEAISAHKTATRDALQLLFDNVNKGQRKQLTKNEEIKEMFDRFGVNYEGD